MEYHFKTWAENGEHWAECLELQGCFAASTSKNGLASEMEESLNLYLKETPDSKIKFNLPDYDYITGDNVVAVQVRPNIAFANALRQRRLKSKLSHTLMKNKLGLSTVEKYRNLENPNKTNPSMKTIKEISDIFPKLDLSYIL